MGFVPACTGSFAAATGLLWTHQQHHAIPSVCFLPSITTTSPIHQLSGRTSALAAAPPVMLHDFFDHAVAATSVASDMVTTALSSPQDPASLVTDPSIDPDLLIQMEEESLSALGHDILLFLAASVMVEPLGKIVGVTPVLLYLLFGFAAGPYGLSLFTSGTQVNSEIGDFGILFLLFVEGLNLSPERLKALGSFFSLGAAQLSISVVAIFVGLFFGSPYLLPITQQLQIPLDPEILSLLDRPVIAFSIAAAGALSSSAFVLPILKEKGWEAGADGIATLAILLLQDLAVAPLLVALPLLADTGSSDPMSLAVLLAKATLGFGGVLVAASIGLRKIFQIVARFGSAQTFIAASLLVAAGMGVISDYLGLSSTTGAFAAGVLLAESGYRAQIEADIKPFEGILLGVFFVTAGASLDPLTVLQEWPTLAAGIGVFLAIKFGVVLAAGEFALGLTRAQALRVAFLLAGGGEFAFVVFKLANNIGVLPEDLYKLLTASVIISMSLTPLLGELAVWSSNIMEERESTVVETVNGELGTLTFGDYDVNLADDDMIREAFERFDEDGNGSICADELQQILTRPGTTAGSKDSMLSTQEIENIIKRFDEDGDGALQFEEFAALWTAKRRNESSTSALSTEDSSIKKAIVICGYGEVAQQLCATLRQPYVAFSRDPERISQGVRNGARVVYGNGASPGLVNSVGIEEPAAIVVAYATQDRCLEATARLSKAFPATPLYVRTARLDERDELLEAGATKVVVETRKVALSFNRLLTMDTSIKEKVSKAVTKLSGEEREIPFSEGELVELAFVCDMRAQELGELYALFITSLNRNENGQVQLAELRNELMRRRNIPVDDETMKKWMGYEEVLSKWKTGDAEVKWVGFEEFAKFAAGKL